MNLTFDILTLVNVKIMVFQYVMPCSLNDGYKNLWGRKFPPNDGQRWLLQNRSTYLIKLTYRLHIPEDYISVQWINFHLFISL